MGGISLSITEHRITSHIYAYIEMSFLQRTLIILKPDAVQRCLVGKILSRFETKGLKILSCRMDTLDTGIAEEHYVEHKGKPFYNDLVTFMTGGPCVLLALEGLNAVTMCRHIIGTQDIPGTIRGDYCQYKTYNLVHGSDSPEAAKRELGLFFPRLVDFTVEASAPRCTDLWLMGPAPEFEGEKEIRAQQALTRASPFLSGSK